MTTPIEPNSQKIILIGDGMVGSSYAFALTLDGLGRELGILDLDADKAQADVWDLNDALAYRSPKQIFAATYEDCADAGLVVLCAGAAQKPGETRLDLVDKNLKIFYDMVSKIMATGFNGILLVATNPVDVLSYATWRFSGLPSSHVIGTGTALDSARLRSELAHLVGVDARNVHAYIMGEHGDSEFPVWSHANVAGLPLHEWIVQNPTMSSRSLNDAFENVKSAAYRIIEKKGATYYGIAASLARMTKAILRDERSISACSALLDGDYGLHDIYIGAPAILGAGGIDEVINIPLELREREQMNESARILRQTIDTSFERLEADLGITIPAGIISDRKGLENITFPLGPSRE